MPGERGPKDDMGWDASDPWEVEMSFEVEFGNRKEEECRWEGLSECKLSHEETGVKNVETERCEQPADSFECWQEESLAGSLEIQETADAAPTKTTKCMALVR